MNKIIDYFKSNIKQINWKAMLFLTLWIQVIEPLIFWVIDRDWVALYICTTFCCILIYPVVIWTILFGREK